MVTAGGPSTAGIARLIHAPAAAADFPAGQRDGLWATGQHIVGTVNRWFRGTAETGAETRSSSGRTVQYRRRFPPPRALRASTTAAPLRAGRSPCRAVSGPENP